MSQHKSSDSLRRAIDALGLTDKQKKKLDLHVLPQIVERMEKLTPECLPCHEMSLEAGEFISMLPELQTNPQMRKAFKKKLKTFENHLAKSHDIHREGFYTGFWMAIGVALGTTFMTLLDNPAFIGVGVAIGAGLGASKEKKAKQEDRLL